MSDTYVTIDLEKSLAALSRGRLEEMRLAGEAILDCYRVLQKAEQNIVGQCIAHQGTFYELDHYPKGDVYDREHHAQYYYHSHRKESGEHGHFHTFVRAKGMPKGILPVAYKGKAKRPTGDDALAHFIAISMSGPGFPVSLFTTNRWVTDETFYKAEDNIAMLDRFKIDHTFPCLAVNRWITALVDLFRPQIKELMLVRDKTIKNWAATHPGIDVYEDRDLEITSIMNIDVDRQIAAVEAALGDQRITA